MATLTEATVKVIVTLTRDPQTGDHVNVSAQSYGASGDAVRLLAGADITSELSPAQLTTVANILAAVESRVKARGDIP